MIEKIFQIAKITPYGDSDNGESYSVVSHDCPNQETEVIIPAGFGKQSKEIKTITCDTCGKTAILDKDINDSRIIYIA